jgi:UDP-N-acetylglucosamine transferase subunit ALG13
MARVLVTVGMSAFPFDRLVRAIEPVCPAHDVYAQIGASTITPPCPWVRQLPFDEMRARLADADVVVTHAGNTVRLVQSLGGVPVAIARTAAHGEMRNNHQVAFLRAEETRGRVIAVWDLAGIPAVVDAHATLAAAIRAERPAVPRADPVAIADQLDAACARLLRGRMARD